LKWFYEMYGANDEIYMILLIYMIFLRLTYVLFVTVKNVLT